MCLKPRDIKTPQGWVQGQCRICSECRRSRASMWSMRCMQELKQHTKSVFITLTYERSPVLLVKRDLQLFIKRVRKKFGAGIKYFACGEYGDLRLRPHYHIIFFGLDFCDKYYWSTSNSGHAIMRSATLELLWTLGQSTVQDVTANSCAYTALYSAKPKISLPLHLQFAPEFNLMSKGLGLNVILANMDTYLKTDEIYVDGVRHPIPQVALNHYYGKDSVVRNIQKGYINIKRKRMYALRSRNSDELVGARYRENQKKLLTRRTL